MILTGLYQKFLWVYHKFIKQDESIDYAYYINVKETMKNTELPRPKHRSRFLVTDGEILPIILVESGEV